jgi:hypothetical protein
LNTTNAGKNWELQLSGTSDDLFSINFSSSISGWISGENGILLKTTDGGTSWVEQARLTRMPLYSIFFTDVNTGWAVGSFGTIIKTTNGGVTFVEEEEILEVPTEFVLYQNYPNPFNPTTKISWQSSTGSWQTLKVFNVLGNEIATLIDEYKPAGKYDVQFIASDLPSGIYFYKLQAGNFVETKKMVLIK